MNKRKYVIAVSTSILLILILISMYMLKTIRTNSYIDIDKHDMKRLKSYSYYKKEPLYDFEKLKSQHPDKQQEIYNDFFTQDIMQFDENEEFISNKDLIYITSDNSCAIRGILKTTLQDGTTKMQDVEIIFNYGTIDGPEYIRYDSHRFLDDNSQ